MPQKHLADYLLLLVLAVVWSVSFLLIKVAVASIAPVTLTAARMCIASAMLAGGLVLGGQGLPLHRRALLVYFVVGFFGNTFPFILISWGETHVDSSLAAIMMGVMPITTFILAHFFIPQETITARKAFGVMLGLGGLLLLVGSSALRGLGAHALGQLAVLGGAISYGITAVFVRAQPDFPKFEMATGAVVAGMLTSLPLAFYLEEPLLMTPSVAAIWCAVALGVFSTGMASLIYFRVIRNLGAVTFSQLNYAVPVLGSIWGVLWLNEWLQARMLVALALVIIGIYFVQGKRGDAARLLFAKARGKFRERV